MNKVTYTIRLNKNTVDFLQKVRQAGLSTSALIELLIRKEMEERRIISNLLGVLDERKAD
jgi:lambda repressor-like predicted transcriptional regulator